ncbi:beta-galactosidase [Colwellia echini]|uniref:Glycoside hydrolase family 42 N-terminal domain-containing protein n=1 Tax=Colwellia echini TaxID=1982103 RepID=A0ABY3MYC6_9GAMM|nr:beta-galactosidase [Colwellia echini]TYK66230.1 hypothetical protein CWS31_006430 [Colwellia echini]
MNQLMNALTNFCLVIFFSLFSCYVQSSQANQTEVQKNIQVEIQANILEKVAQLKSLITTAEFAHIDVSREKMTVHLTSLFIDWAIWDENNVAKNIPYYLDHPVYKKNAQQLAETLPDFQRKSLIIVLEQAIEELQQVISGAISRKPVPVINWNTVEIIDNQFIDNGKPVFLGTYTWKTDNTLSNQYFGNLNSAYIAPSMIVNKELVINENKYLKIKRDIDQRIGQVFVSHSSIPQWPSELDPNFNVGKRLFSDYDIDNPLAKILFSTLFKNYVPLFKDKRSSQLGYMLFNEPSFFTQADSWNNGPVSAYTKAKFKVWLKNKHQSIEQLNTLWHSDFESFDTLDVEVPMQAELRGSPVWFDWMRFNQYRVTQWFTFLDSEIKKYDSHAKNHIKLMPWLWNTDTRDHGLDFESLLEITDVIGFDANSQYSSFRGVQPYEADYSFDWQSMAMSFDFFSSIQPEQLLWDSENHFFNNVKFQERDLDPDYVRSIYWLASTHGLAGASTWLWGRNHDGSIINRKKQNSEYITEVTHQPIGFHSLTRTLMDINANGADIQLLRKAPKSIRIFYSETSAINQTDYMTAIRETYRSLYFEGTALGFATEKIINNQENDWQVIVITNTPNVTTKELQSLTRFAQDGGTLLIDNNSLLFDEYNQKHDKASYPTGKNVFPLTNLENVTAQVNSILLSKGKSPVVVLTELTTDSTNKSSYKSDSYKHNDDNFSENDSNNDNAVSKSHKTLTWRIAQKNTKTSIVSIVNTGHQDKMFYLKSAKPNRSISILNLHTGNEESSLMKIGKRKTLLLEVTNN